MVTAFEYVEDCNRKVFFRNIFFIFICYCKVLNYGWIEFPLAYTQV